MVVVAAVAVAVAVAADVAVTRAASAAGATGWSWAAAVAVAVAAAAAAATGNSGNPHRKSLNKFPPNKNRISEEMSEKILRQSPYIDKCLSIQVNSVDKFCLMVQFPIPKLNQNDQIM